MIEYVNKCVGCTDLGLYCLEDACPNRKVPLVFCDDCGGEIVDNVIEYNHHHYHAECVIYPLLKDRIIEEKKI